MTCAALIGMRCAFLLIQRLPAGFGDFQYHAFDKATQAGLEIQHAAAAASAKKVKGQSRIGQNARADRADRCRVMAMARAPIAPIKRVGI